MSEFKHTQRIFVFCLVMLVCFVWPAFAVDSSIEALLKDSGIKGGVIVHIGCGDAGETVSLLKSGDVIVHGLDVDPAKIEQARAFLKSKGLYKKIKVETFDGVNLPYADNMINLVVVSGDDCKVPVDEVKRVLAPRGVAVGTSGFTKYTKPVPEDIDEWTHFLHDAGNNAVAADEKVAPPRSIKWVADPLWLRSHETPSGVQALVSGNGRVFYIFDEGLVGILDERLPDRWAIYARDAFNGKLLWKKPLEKWGWREWALDKWKGKDWTTIRAGRVAVPSNNQRRLVVDGDKLYATLSFDAPLSVLDACTGEILATVKDTEHVVEIFTRDGTVYVKTGGENAALIAIDSSDYSVKWRRPNDGGGPYMTAVYGNNIFMSQGKILAAIDIKTGEQKWERPSPGKKITTVIAVENGLLIKDMVSLMSINIADGSLRWKKEIERCSGGESVDLFVIDGVVYPGLLKKDEQGKSVDAENAFTIGWDVVSGELKKRIFASKLRSPEHHHRCYRNIATSRYIITSYEGAEFLDLKGENHLQQNWVRGACAMGMVPANGMLYVPSDQCFCSPGAKVLGFTALEGERTIKAVPGDKRLSKGSAYSKPVKGSGDDKDAWPTFRHDAARHGATGTKVASEVATVWKKQLGGNLTAPVAAGKRIFVARKDENTLYALDLDSGETAWTYTARGSIDSPPSIYNGYVLFGGMDGRVYCLRESDGEEVWTFLAAPEDRRICAFERLESTWPVHGSVLVLDGMVYAAAGRSSYFDGGVRIYALDPATGKVVHEGLVEGPIWKTGERELAFFSRGANADVLVAEGDFIYMRQRKLTKDLKVVDVPVLSNKGAEDVGMHVFSTAGLLDDSWYNRTFWMYSKRWPGFQLAYQSPKAGQLLVVDEKQTYAVKAFYQRNVHSGFFFPATKGYLLFADENTNEPQIYGEEGAVKPLEWLPQSDFLHGGDRMITLDQNAFGYDKGVGYSRAKPAVWQKFVPVRIRAMVKTRDVLFVAGPPDVYDDKDPYAAFEGRKGGVLASISPATGEIIHSQKNDSPPVFNGMIAAYGKIFMCLHDGTVVCLKGK